MKNISGQLRKLGIASIVDASGVSIGKCYARNDELGTPLGITIDFESLKDRSITLRERDSTNQVRGSQERIIESVQHLVVGLKTWEDVAAGFPAFTGPSTED